MYAAPTYAACFTLNLRRRKNDPSSELVPSTKGTRLKSPDLMISLGCAVRKGSGLAAVLTSLTGLQNMSYCVTQRETVGDWVMDWQIMNLQVHMNSVSCFSEDTRCGLQGYGAVYCGILLCCLDPEGVQSSEMLVPTGQTKLDLHNRISTNSVPRYLF